VDEIHEVEEGTRKLREAQEQLKKCARILQQLPTEQKQRLYKFVDWSQIETIYPIVVTPYSDPGQEFDHSEIPAVSYAMLKTHMRPNHLASPQKLWQRSIDRPWIERDNDAKAEYWPIEIGPVTYEIPMRVSYYE
jgi:hypothetical protein